MHHEPSFWLQFVSGHAFVLAANILVAALCILIDPFNYCWYPSKECFCFFARSDHYHHKMSTQSILLLLCLDQSKLRVSSRNFNALSQNKCGKHLKIGICHGWQSLCPTTVHSSKYILLQQSGYNLNSCLCIRSTVTILIFTQKLG